MGCLHTHVSGLGSRCRVTELHPQHQFPAEAAESTPGRLEYLCLAISQWTFTGSRQLSVWYRGFLLLQSISHPSLEALLLCLSMMVNGVTAALKPNPRESVRTRTNQLTESGMGKGGEQHGGEASGAATCSFNRRWSKWLGPLLPLGGPGGGFWLHPDPALAVAAIWGAKQ